MRPLSGTEAEQDIRREAHRLIRLQPSLTFSEAVAQACRGDPMLYTAYDKARTRDVAANFPPDAARDQPRKASEPSNWEKEKATVDAELHQAAEDAEMKYEDYCLEHPDGQQEYAVLDAMTTRLMRRKAAEEFLGRS